MAITDSTLYVLCDDQNPILKAFTLAARLLHIDEKSYAMFTKSADMLDVLNGQQLSAFLLDWSIIGSPLQKAELVREVRRRRPDIPIYILSTSVDPQDIKDAKDAGAKGWISKAKFIQNLRRWRDEHQNVEEFYVWK